MVRQRDEQKSEALLDAALVEIATAGLAGLSIDAVAKRSRIASGTVYVYFTGKDALIEALYSKVKREFARLTFRDAGVPVRPGVEEACRRYLDYCLEHANELIFLDQIERSPVWRSKVSATTAIAMRPLVALLERGKAERLVKDIDSDTLIAFLASGLQASARLLAHEGARRRERRASEIISLCWGAIVA